MESITFDMIDSKCKHVAHIQVFVHGEVQSGQVVVAQQTMALWQRGTRAKGKGNTCPLLDTVVKVWQGHQ